MHRKSFVSAAFASLTFLTASTFCFAKPVEKIEFYGLKRTNPEYAANILGEYIGKESDEINIKDIENNLHLCGLFSDYKVEIDDENGIIKAEVEEKFSIMPIPFVMYGSNGFQGGLFFMDMNAFGRQDMFVGGMHFSTENFNLLGVFSKRPKGHIPGLTLTAGFSNGINKITTIDKHEVEDYNSLRFNFGGNLNFPITKHFSAGIGAKYEYFYLKSNLNEEDKLLFAEYGGLEKTHAVSFPLGLSISSKPKYNGFFSISNTLNYTFESGFVFGESETKYQTGHYVSSALSSNFFTPRLIQKLFLNFSSINGAKANHLLGKNKSALTIASSAWKTDFIASFSYGLEWAFLKMKFGTFSLYGNYEGGEVKIIEKDKYEFVHGFGCGMRMYLSKVAMPAMAFGLSYNVPYNKVQMAFSIGVSM